MSQITNYCARCGSTEGSHYCGFVDWAFKSGYIRGAYDMYKLKLLSEEDIIYLIGERNWELFKRYLTRLENAKNADSTEVSENT